MNELEDKKTRLKANRPSSAEMAKTRAEIKVLENRLEHALNTFNDL